MKSKITLLPLEGFTVSQKKISFEQSKSEVISLLGNADREDGSQFFYESLDLRLDFNETGHLVFAEAYGPYSENAEFNIYGINPFTSSDQDLIELLKNKNGDGEVDDFEEPYCFGFFDISVGIWRGSIPDDIEDAIEELQEEGTYEESKEILDQEMNKSKHFWTVGIGKADYYKI